MDECQSVQARIISLDKYERNWTNVHISMDICPSHKLLVVSMRLDVKSLSLGVIMSSAGAFALAESHFSATLAQPVAAKEEFVVNGNLFRCEGSACILVSTGVDALSVYTCRALQRKVGALVAYGAEGSQFDAAKLARCNAPN
jgi:hypothetical protein